MIELITFILTHFWPFVGAVMLIYAIGEAIARIFHGPACSKCSPDYCDDEM